MRDFWLSTATVVLVMAPAGVLICWGLWIAHSWSVWINGKLRGK